MVGETWSHSSTIRAIAAQGELWHQYQRRTSVVQSGLSTTFWPWRTAAMPITHCCRRRITASSRVFVASAPPCRSPGRGRSTLPPLVSASSPRDYRGKPLCKLLSGRRGGVRGVGSGADIGLEKGSHSRMIPNRSQWVGHPSEVAKQLRSRRRERLRLPSVCAPRVPPSRGGTPQRSGLVVIIIIII